MNTKKTTIDKIRLVVLTCAELFDAWRVIPRLLVGAYGWLCWQIVVWYTSLAPSVIVGCDIQALGELCLYDAPTTQHAALVTVMVGASAAVFGLYTNTGRTWTNKFVRWDDTHTQQHGNGEYGGNGGRGNGGRGNGGRGYGGHGHGDQRGFSENGHGGRDHDPYDDPYDTNFENKHRPYSGRSSKAVNTKKQHYPEDIYDIPSSDDGFDSSADIPTATDAEWNDILGGK